MSSFIDGLCRVSDSVSVDVRNGRASGRRVSGAKVKDDEFITYAERNRQRARSEAAAKRAFYKLLRDEAVRAAWEDYYIDNKSRIDLLSWERTLEELERVAKGSTVSDSCSGAKVKDANDDDFCWCQVLNDRFWQPLAVYLIADLSPFEFSEEDGIVFFTTYGYLRHVRSFISKRGGNPDTDIIVKSDKGDSSVRDSVRRPIVDSRARAAAVRRHIADAATKSGWGPLQGNSGREGFTKHYDAPVESIDITKKGDKYVMYINPASILSKELKDYLGQYYASTAQEAKKRADAIARHLIALHKEFKDGHVKDDAKCDDGKKAEAGKAAAKKPAAVSDAYKAALARVRKVRDGGAAELVEDAASKLWYLGYRSNPQLKSGGYYRAFGQLSKKDAKAHESSVYGGMSMTAYSTQEEYDAAIAKAEAEGYRVSRS